MAKVKVAAVVTAALEVAVAVEVAVAAALEVAVVGREALEREALMFLHEVVLP